MPQITPPSPPQDKTAIIRQAQTGQYGFDWDELASAVKRKLLEMFSEFTQVPQLAPTPKPEPEPLSTHRPLALLEERPAVAIGSEAYPKSTARTSVDDGIFYQSCRPTPFWFYPRSTSTPLHSIVLYQSRPGRWTLGVTVKSDYSQLRDRIKNTYLQINEEMILGDIEIDSDIDSFSRPWLTFDFPSKGEACGHMHPDNVTQLVAIASALNAHAPHETVKCFTNQVCGRFNFPKDSIERIYELGDQLEERSPFSPSYYNCR